MKDHEGDFKGFIQLSRAWYGDACLSGRREKIVDEVSFGFYSPGGGTSGEMLCCWYQLGNGAPVPRLEAFDDAWHALSLMPDLIARLAEVDERSTTPAEFCRILTECGFVDRTEETEPGRKSSRKSEADYLKRRLKELGETA